MERISAASNLIIEVQPQSWRLLANGDGTERVLVEAVAGEPLRYGSNFGSRRNLPDSGILQSNEIQGVVLGWSEKDDSWHLGLVLKGDLVDERGSRWCGLAHWHDPLANQYQTAAVQAGQGLAEQVSRPFTMIPPHASEGITSEITASQEMVPTTRIGVSTLEPVPEPIAIPQPELPLHFDLWTLRQADATHLELGLSPAYGRSKLIRVAWNIVWLGVFIVLVVTTLTSGIALPRPEILVYFGYASIVVLILVILYNLIQSATYTNRIVIAQAGVRWSRGKRARRTIPVAEIQEVYVSHVISKVGRRGKSSLERSVHFGELTLLMKDGKFESVVIQLHTDDVIPVTDDPLNEEAIVALTEYNARTELQSAGLRIARTLGVNGEYDKRLK